MNTKSTITLEEAKIQATILLKSIRTGQPERSLDALKRVQRQGILSDIDAKIIPKNIKLKHTLEVIAKEHQYASWAVLKKTLEIKPTEDFVASYSSGFLNHWFADYGQAKEYLTANGGYLLPYKSQFFVCDRGYIENIGLNANDSDWQAIGFDWFMPTQKAAWQRLRKKLQNAAPNRKM